MDRRRQVQHGGLVAHGGGHARGIVPNGEGEPVWLTPHQRDSQPGGDRESRSLRRTSMRSLHSLQVVRYITITQWMPSECSMNAVWCCGRGGAAVHSAVHRPPLTVAALLLLVLGCRQSNTHIHPATTPSAWLPATVSLSVSTRPGPHSLIHSGSVSAAASQPWNAIRPGAATCLAFLRYSSPRASAMNSRQVTQTSGSPSQCPGNTSCRPATP